MFSDTLATIFLPIGIEGGALAPDFLGKPGETAAPLAMDGGGEGRLFQGEIDAIKKFKDAGTWMGGCYVAEDACEDGDWEELCKGQDCYEKGKCGDCWLEGATNPLRFGEPKDPTRGVSIMADGAVFNGYSGAGTMYFDIPYSHSVLFIFLFAIPFCLWHKFKEGKTPIAVVGVMLAFLSHPLLDIIFHDASFGFGSRTQAVSLGLWRSNSWTVALWFLEPLCVYYVWKTWKNTLHIKNKEVWAKNAKIYWLGEIFYCNYSWYSAYPLGKMTWEILPKGQRLGENIYMLCVIIFSWAWVLYFVRKLEDPEVSELKNKKEQLPQSDDSDEKC